MNHIRFGIIAVIILLTILKSVNSQRRLVCFWNPMASNRNNRGIFVVKQIDPHLCTHLVYGYFNVGTDGTVHQPQFGNVDEVFIYNFVNLRRINPDVKVIASIGGPDFPPEIFLSIARNDVLRLAFANKVFQFLTDFNFDGVDFYWPFPSGNEKEEFVALLEEVSNILMRNGKSLTISVTPNGEDALKTYDLARIEPFVEFINLDVARLRDIHEKPYVAVPHAPLHPLSVYDQLNVESIVSHWQNDIVPYNKIVVGIPTYGRTYTLANSNNYHVGNNVIGNGRRGDHGAANIRGASILPFNEICYNLEYTTGWREFFHDTTGSPYAVYGDDLGDNQWVSYDDVPSVVEKTKFVIEQQHLGGIAFYDIDMDDFANNCGLGYFPLLRAAFNRIFNDTDGVDPGDPNLTTTTEDPNFTTSSSSDETTTTFPILEFSCVGRPDGNYQNPANCRTFFTCANGFRFLMNCPGTLFYHEEPDRCLHTIPQGCLVPNLKG